MYLSLLLNIMPALRDELGDCPVVYMHAFYLCRLYVGIPGLTRGLPRLYTYVLCRLFLYRLYVGIPR